LKRLLYFYTAMKKIISVIFVTLVFISCRSFFRDTIREPETIPFKFTGKTNLFNDSYFNLEMDSLNNYITIKLRGRNELQKFPFPKDKNGKALTATAFSFVFFENKKPIESDNLTKYRSKTNQYSYFGYTNWLTKNILYNTDTIDLSKGVFIEFKIPLFAFHKLKAGEHELEMRCSQNLFCSESKYQDSSSNYKRNYAKTSLLAFSIKFKIKVPPIFKTTLYGLGIELRNDSVFSPAGMDNTIWNSSYPDVYWTISYPNEDFYCSSDYKKSTDFYDIKDTFCLYHYTPNDSIALGVWDHDNLSRDDYISYKKFSLNQFPQNKNYKFKFQNIKCFELRMMKEVAVNR
jgi:hypothetical protein